MSKRKAPVLKEEELRLLVEDLKGCLRVCTFSPEDWQAATPQIKAALITASKELDAERLLALVTAFTSQEGLLSAVSVLDGGQAAVDFKLKTALKSFIFGKKGA